MPRFNVKTISGNQIWASPDGQRKIYELVVDVDGKQLKAKTYSDAISQTGWSGEVETYEKPNRNGGMDTFVKQPPKEGGFQSHQGSQSGTTGGGSSRSSYVPKDENAIKAMWAIGQATTVVTGAGIPFSEKEFYPSVETVATNLFGLVDRVKTGEAPQDTVHDVPPEDITVEDLGEALDLGETPWPNQS